MSKFLTFSGTINGKRIVDARPAVVDGVAQQDYWATRCGNMISTKGRKPRLMKSKISGKSEYPRVGIRINAATIQVSLHRVVCETYIPFGCPSDISLKNWARTPRQVKDALRQQMVVNHKNHVKTDARAVNLEWATSKENSQKSVQHYAKS